MKPLDSVHFLCVGTQIVCFQDDEAAFGFETGKRRQEGAKIFSLKSLCSNATPSSLNMDSSKLLGSTTWTDPQLREKMFFQFKFRFSYQNRKESDTDFFLSIIFCVSVLLLRNVGWFTDVFQTELQRTEVGLGFNAMVEQTLSFTPVNSVVNVGPRYCARRKPESEVQIR